MIDWIETEKQCGITEVTATKLSRVVVECDSCHQNRIISYHGYKRLIREQSNSLCTSCRNRQNREKYSNNYKESDRQRSVALSKTMKEKWSNNSYREKQVSSIHTSKDKHSVASKKLWEDSEYRSKVVGSVKGLYNDPAYRKMMDEIYSSSEYRQKLSDNWKRPEYREKVLIRWSDPICKANFAAACAERSRLLWQNENYRMKMIEAAKLNKEFISILWKDDDYRSRVINSLREIWGDEDLRADARVISKRLWSDPFYRERVMVSLFAVKQKMSDIAKAKWTPDFRIKMKAAFELIRPLIVESSKKNWRNIEYRNRVIPKISAAIKRKWQELEYQNKMAVAMSD